MTIPAAAKVAAAAAADPKLLKIAGGILLGAVIIIIAPIALMLGIGDAAETIDWQSVEIRQIYETITDEQKARTQNFADIMRTIEDEIAARGLTVEPIKAQVFWLCTLGRIEPDSAARYADFVDCFPDGAADENIFANINSAFGASFTAEEKEKILLLADKAVESQTVPPTALHMLIGTLTAESAVTPTQGLFQSPFRDRDWQACLSSGYGKRRDPFTGETAPLRG